MQDTYGIGFDTKGGDTRAHVLGGLCLIPKLVKIFYAAAFDAFGIPSLLHRPGGRRPAEKRSVCRLEALRDNRRAEGFLHLTSQRAK